MARRLITVWTTNIKVFTSSLRAVFNSFRLCHSVCVRWSLYVKGGGPSTRFSFSRPTLASRRIGTLQRSSPTAVNVATFSTIAALARGNCKRLPAFLSAKRPAISIEHGLGQYHHPDPRPIAATNVSCLTSHFPQQCPDNLANPYLSHPKMPPRPPSLLFLGSHNPSRRA